MVSNGSMTAVDKDVDMGFIGPSTGTICPDDYMLAYQGKKYTKCTDSAVGVRHGLSLCRDYSLNHREMLRILLVPTAR